MQLFIFILLRLGGMTWDGIGIGTGYGLYGIIYG